jgi:hypothetical protein
MHRSVDIGTDHYVLRHFGVMTKQSVNGGLLGGLAQANVPFVTWQVLDFCERTA